MASQAAHIIVVGNEKGGCGKTTIAMHLAVALLQLGFGVACIDLDHRQQSLTRYFKNRVNWVKRSGVFLSTPDFEVLRPSNAEMREEARREEEDSLNNLVRELGQNNDFIIIDCPGSDVWLSRHAHTLADTLVTPINDSLLDLDLLGQLDPITWELKSAGVYAQLVWELRNQRRREHKAGIDWVVMRSRLGALADRNKRKMADVLPQMQKIMGFRLADGFGERVIYRYLFLWGLTVLDLEQAGIDEKTQSGEAAKAEVESLLRSLWIPRVTQALSHFEENLVDV